MSVHASSRSIVEAVGRASGPNAAPALRSMLAQARMELLLTSRRGENLLVTIVIPVGMLLIFSTVGVGPISESRAVDFLLPGILALAVISTSMVNLGIATAYERYYGVLKRLGGSPLPRAGLLGAKVLSVLFVEVVQAVLLVGIGVVVLHWSPGPGASLALAVATLLLGTLTFAGLGLLMAGTLRAEATLAGTNALYLLLLVVGGVVLPPDHLPVALADLGWVLPAAAFSDSMRIALGSQSGSAILPLAWLAVWGVGVAFLAARSFRWE